MSKKTHRRPAAFRVEEVEVFVPPVTPDVAAEPVPLPAPRVRAVPDLGRGHVPEGSAITYDSVPPTSGSHYAAKVAPWGSYTARIEDPVVVHNLEHGGIAIAYDGIDEATVKQLDGLLTTFPRSRYGNRVKLVIHPDDRLAAGEIVLTAWARMDRLTGYDEARIRAFYEAHLDRCCESVP